MAGLSGPAHTGANRRQGPFVQEDGLLPALRGGPQRQGCFGIVRNRWQLNLKG